MTTIDRLIRSGRRTVSIEIAEDASLVVRAPYDAPLDRIHSFVRDRSPWIVEKRQAARQKLLQAEPHRFIPGELFLYRGRSYPLAICDRSAASLTLDNEFRLSSSHTHHPHIVFANWYKREAAREIEDRLKALSAASGLSYRSCAITNARKQWGSCDLQCNLRFTWRLIMAPPEVIEYVISHELAHTAEHNHSPRFWDRVGRLCPSFREHRRWLRDNGHLLRI